MTPDDHDPRRVRWDSRYARGEELHGLRPASPLPTAVAIQPPGHALDLACGAGRHALFLAERGWHVDAVDLSPVGLELLRREAERLGLAERIAGHVADLEAEPPGFTIGLGTYDMIVDICFLHRPLLAHVPAGLRAGGLFVAAIHCDEPGQPRAHQFTLAPGELRATVQAWGLEILEPRDASVTEGRRTAEIIARRR